MTLGEYIKQYRTSHSLSMEEFGKRADITKQYVSVLERGEKSTVPSIATYEKIAAATNVTLEELAAIVNGRVTPSTEREEISLIAEELHKDPELRMLFSLARDAKPEDLKMCADMLRRFKETGR